MDRTSCRHEPSEVLGEGRRRYGGRGWRAARTCLLLPERIGVDGPLDGERLIRTDLAELPL